MQIKIKYEESNISGSFIPVYFTWNELTGMNQHTGNWTGKTVTAAFGKYNYEDESFILVDLPGTYSLTPNSKEEEVTRDFIAF